MFTALDGRLGTVKADPGQIEQVIMNLAVNARDAMPDGGKLTIETANVDARRGLRSHALGRDARRATSCWPSPTPASAWTPRRKRRIFEPFFTTKELGKGTGLGLATVYRHRQAERRPHLGLQRAGQGHDLQDLPAARRCAGGREFFHRDAPSQLAVGTETILLVEDEEALRTLTRDLLLECKYQVIEARDGIHALELAAKCEGRIHLLLTDVVMPKLGGPALAEQLILKHPEMKVLYMSGYTGRSAVSGGLVSVEAGVLAKPFTREALTRKVREVLDAEAVQSPR